jgi:hypothetical protein
MAATFDGAMRFHETRVAIVATIAGLVLATGIGAAATPPPPVTAAPAAPQQADVQVVAPAQDGTFGARGGR